ncbi:MAG: AbrB/MazE/SpoVT family DNA-binding domain-containing protein [Candidatus Heimdallarchaeota archaeon]
MAEVVVIGKKFLMEIPKEIREKANLKEGQKVKLTVKGKEIILQPIIDPLELALTASKFAETTFEEFEQESEEMQNELFKER